VLLHAGGGGRRPLNRRALGEIEGEQRPALVADWITRIVQG
jgi:hypothetical protein